MHTEVADLKSFLSSRRISSGLSFATLDAVCCRPPHYRYPATSHTSSYRPELLLKPCSCCLLSSCNTDSVTAHQLNGCFGLLLFCAFPFDWNAHIAQKVDVTRIEYCLISVWSINPLPKNIVSFDRPRPTPRPKYCALSLKSPSNPTSE